MFNYKFIKFIFLIFVLNCLNSITSFSQFAEITEHQTTDSLQIMKLEYEDLLDIKVVTASRKEESVFSAPVSSYVRNCQFWCHLHS